MNTKQFNFIELKCIDFKSNFLEISKKILINKANEKTSLLEYSKYEFYSKLYLYSNLI